LCFLKPLLLLGISIPDEIIATPEIIRFDLPTKYNKTSNTSFCRSSDGIFFIGKQNGLITIDDEQVYFKPLNSPVFVSRTNNNELYYLSENDLGIIDFDPGSGPQFTTLLKDVEVENALFKPLGVTSLGSLSFLSTTAGVYVLSANTIDYFFKTENSPEIYNSGNNVLFLQPGKGLYIWTGYDFIQLIDSEFLEKSNISGIFEIGESLLIQYSNGNKQYFSFNAANSAAHIISDPGIHADFKGIIHSLCDNQYLIENTEGNILLMNREDFKTTVLAPTGLLPNTPVRTLCVDSYKDVWIVYDFSIYKLEFPSRVTTLNLSSLISGTIHSTQAFNNFLYVASNEGIYRIPISSIEESIHPFLIQGSAQLGCHLLSSCGDILLAAGVNGLYEIKGTYIQPVRRGNFFFLYSTGDDTFLGCNESGLVKFSRSGNGWISELLYPGIQQVISETVYENSTWITTGDNQIFRISGSDAEIIPVEELVNEGLWRITKIGSKLFLIGEKFVYSWNSQQKRFYPVTDNSFTRFLDNADLIISGENSSWGTLREMDNGYTLWDLSEHKITVPYYVIPAEKQFGQVIDIIDLKTVLWITGNKKLIKLNLDSLDYVTQDWVRIQNAQMVFPEKNFRRINLYHGKVYRYHRNKTSFKLAPSRYIKDSEVYFRYRISHYQDEWSSWNREKNIEFDNLKERKYIFEAQGATSFDNISDPVRLEFKINPPIYRTWYAYLVYFLFILVNLFLIYKWRLLNLKKAEYKIEEQVREKMATVLREKEKSDKLVEDLFPKGTADELRNSGRAKSRKFELVTVLFSDIQGFTKIAEEMNPEVLIDELDKFFFHFDSVVDKYNIEKIKTIGDAYMAAGGIPVKNSSNPVEVVLAGLEMQHYMKDLKKKKKTNIWDLRIGIHTGPVISGVVGHKKLSYDIWGDTVNTASRMESSGEGGKVNISGTTYSLVKEFFICEYRGKLPVKYKGNIDMYFVTGLRPELSVDLHGIPNRRFFLKLQLIRLKDIEERIIEKIIAKYGPELQFHKPTFIQKVVNQAEMLSRAENLSLDETLLTSTAAILLYAGLSETYENFENKSVDIATSLLPEYGYDDKQINTICNLILATKSYNDPQNKLENILIDARYEYLGKMDYMTYAKLLFMESRSHQQGITREKFIASQTRLLETFEYKTLAAQRLREVESSVQITNLKSWK